MLLVCLENFGPGGPKLAAKIGPPLPKMVCMRVLRHQQGVVSERKQQASDVPHNVYTREQEWRRNWFVSIYFGKESAMLLYTMYLYSSTLY